MHSMGKKLINNDNINNDGNYVTNSHVVNDIDNNDESKYLDIIVGYISSAILRLKSKELAQLNQSINPIQLNQSNQPTQADNSIIQFIPNNKEMTGLNETPKLHQHTIEIEQTNHDDDCDNKRFHDFNNKEDL